MIGRCFLIPITAASFLIAPARLRAGDVWLSTLDVSRIEQDWGQAHADQSVEGRPLQIGGRTFDHGIGSHANSSIPIELDGKADRLSAWVGVDDETEGRGSVVFYIEADGKEIWNSGVMRGGEAAKEIALNLTGVKSLILRASDPIGD
jgi:alpha-galactosidase